MNGRDRQQRVPESDFWKSVGRLEQLAKGAGGDTGTQISQGRQKPHSHPDTSPEYIDNYDGQRYDDDIKEDGTDYNQRETLAHKVMKGEPLTAAEIGILKGDIDAAVASDAEGTEKAGEEADGARRKVEDEQFGGGFVYMADGAKKSEEGSDEGKSEGEGEDEGKTFGGMFGTGQVGGNRSGLGPRPRGGASVGMDPTKNRNPGAIAGTMREHKKFDKSFQEVAMASETIRDGVEISDFLAEMTKAIGVKFEMMEQGVHDHLSYIEKSQAARHAEFEEFRAVQDEFNKSLGEATVGIAHQMGGTVEEMEKAATAPARGPKSVQGAGQPGVRAVEKAFAGGPEIDRDTTLTALAEMVTKGQASSLDVVRYETTGLIEPALMHKAIGMAKSMGLAN